jgi:Na+-driven multidrug efflux pump
MGVFAVVCWAFAAQLVWVFRADPAVVEAGVPALRCMCVAVVAQCLGVVCSMSFQSIGWSGYASFLASLRSGIYYIPTLLVAPRFLGLAGIQSAQMIADILTLLTCIPFAVEFFRRLPDRDERCSTDEAYDEAVRQAA